ncbi:MAG: hypothetical protein FWD53_12915 [Phycisphaerales bacterium]|nr:hypothetical protein [Phycisphaerales bacterium]
MITNETKYNQPDVDSDQDLSGAATRLAAVSPYMEPSADLRGRILQATAPQTFRMEDYRKATQETGRFYRWGFAAACLFLAAGAWYNTTLQKQLTSAVAQLTNAKTHFEIMQHQLTNRDTAIAGLINPKVDQIAIKDQDNRLTARFYVNDAAKTAVVVVPEGSLPPDRTINQITLTRDSKRATYAAVTVTAPREDFPGAVALAAPSLNVQTSDEPGPAIPTSAARLVP